MSVLDVPLNLMMRIQAIELLDHLTVYKQMTDV